LHRQGNAQLAQSNKNNNHRHSQYIHPCGPENHDRSDTVLVPLQKTGRVVDGRQRFVVELVSGFAGKLVHSIADRECSLDRECRKGILCRCTVGMDWMGEND